MANDSADAKATNASASSSKKKGAITKLSLSEFTQVLAEVESTTAPKPFSFAAASTTPLAAGSTAAAPVSKWSEAEIDLPSAPTGETRRSYTDYGQPHHSGSGSYQLSSDYHTDGHRPGRGPANKDRYSQGGFVSGFNRSLPPVGRSLPFGDRPGRQGASPFSGMHGSDATLIDLSVPAEPVDLSRLSRSGPYEAFLGNVPHNLLKANGDSTELLAVMHRLLPSLTATNVSVPLDRESGLPRGFAYITVKTRDDLVCLVECNGRMVIQGRKIRLDVSNPQSPSASSSGFAPSGAKMPGIHDQNNDWRTTAKSLPGSGTAPSSCFNKEDDKVAWRQTAKPLSDGAPVPQERFSSMQAPGKRGAAFGLKNARPQDIPRHAQ